MWWIMKLKLVSSLLKLIFLYCSSEKSVAVLEVSTPRHHMYESKTLQLVLKYGHECFNTCKTQAWSFNRRHYISSWQAAQSARSPKWLIQSCWVQRKPIWCSTFGFRGRAERKRRGGRQRVFTSLTTNTRLGCTDWILTAGFGRPDLLRVSFLNIQGALLRPCWATKRKRTGRKRQESILLFAATPQVR